MEMKLVEIRDAATFIPALAIKISGGDGYLARRAGFGDNPCIYLVKLATQEAHYDPYDWGGGTRTMTAAHICIVDNFDAMRNGEVIDVEFYLGEKPTKKESEALIDG